MPLLSDVAKLLAPTELQRGVIDDISKNTSALFSLLPFRTVNGTSLSYNRLKTASQAAVIGPHGTVPESAASWETCKAEFSRIIGDADIDNLDQVSAKGFADLAATQLIAKKNAIVNKFTDMFINGKALSFSPTVDFGAGSDAVTVEYVSENNDSGQNTNTTAAGTGTLTFTVADGTLKWKAPNDDYGAAVVVSGADGKYTLYSSTGNKYITVHVDISQLPAANESVDVVLTRTYEFDGLKTMSSIAQTVMAHPTTPLSAGASLSFNLLDKLLAKVTNSSRRAILWNSALTPKYLELLRGVNNTPATIKLPYFGQEVLSYRGVPIIENDDISIVESIGSSTNICTSIYVVNFGDYTPTLALNTDDNGGLVAIIPQNQDLTGDASKDIGVRRAGFVAKILTDLETKDVTRVRGIWYTGLLNYSRKSLAHARGVLLT